MKVIFVGIHNKEGYNPLCHSTKSGRLISEIESVLFKNHIYIKRTNLYDINYFPQKFEKYSLAQSWIDRAKPDFDDIIVLLGKEAQNNFQNNGLVIINLPHPASIWSKEKQDKYIESAVSKIMFLKKQLIE